MFKFTLTMFVLLLFGSLTLAQTADFVVTKQKTGTLAWFHSVYFLNRSEGWAAGANGVLLSTQDGGKTWQAADRKPTEDTIREVFFADSMRGWLVCEKTVYKLGSDNVPSYLLQTTDGGASWRRVDFPNEDGVVRIARAFFLPNGSKGWAVGENGTIYALQKDGKTWKKQKLPTRYVIRGGIFINQQNGWLVGSGSTVFLTEDGGENWREAAVAGSEEVRFNAVHFVLPKLGWVVGNGGKIFVSTDGGKTWQAQRSNTAADLLDVKFTSSVEGWAAGANGVLLYTNNAGNTWHIVKTNTPHPLERIFFVGREHGWAVGFGGTILKKE
jgi:photosystem II stability/assembly factor-like uncharacterized protein